MPPEEFEALGVTDANRVSRSKIWGGALVRDEDKGLGVTEANRVSRSKIWGGVLVREGAWLLVFDVLVEEGLGVEVTVSYSYTTVSAGIVTVTILEVTVDGTT